VYWLWRFKRLRLDAAFQPVGEMSAGVNRAITDRRSYVGF
jgi:hypothetical protein